MPNAKPHARGGEHLQLDPAGMLWSTSEAEDDMGAAGAILQAPFEPARNIDTPAGQHLNWSLNAHNADMLLLDNAMPVVDSKNLRIQRRLLETSSDWHVLARQGQGGCVVLGEDAITWPSMRC